MASSEPDRGRPGRLRRSATELLTAWQAPDDAQEALRRAYLQHIEAYDNALLRECRAGHITASTLVVDAARERMLLTLHPIVGRWLQTGGHCEATDADIVAAAAREAREESGIAGLTIDPDPLRLDRHAVRCRPPQGQPIELHHLDVQFLALAPAGAVASRSEESDDLRWFAWDAPPAGLDASVAALMSSARLRMFR